MIASWVVVGRNCEVHSTAIIGHLPTPHVALARQPKMVRRMTIGDGTIIGPYAVIYGGVHIGNDCLIGDGASIREGTIIGDRCVIGRHVTVHYDAQIGSDVRIQDGACITGGCVIGDGCFFGPLVATCNDRRIDLSDYAFHGAEPPRFGRRVMVGAGAIILPGVTIGDDVVIGAGAIVADDIRAGVTVLGHKGRERALPPTYVWELPS